MADHDAVNHPKHYTGHPSGVECIVITRHMNFNLGNVVKYVWRAGHKDEAPTIQDLEKAAWYLNDEIERRKKEEECLTTATTKFCKLLNDGELENDVAQWPHVRNAYPNDTEYAKIVDPPAIPLIPDKKMKTIAPTDIGLKLLWKKDPAVEEMPENVDVMALISRALREKIENNFKIYTQPKNNQFIKQFSYTDEELVEIMMQQDWWHKKEKTHPIWDLIKRGWL